MPAVHGAGAVTRSPPRSRRPKHLERENTSASGVPHAAPSPEHLVLSHSELPATGGGGSACARKPRETRPAADTESGLPGGIGRSSAPGGAIDLIFFSKERSRRDLQDEHRLVTVGLLELVTGAWPYEALPALGPRLTETIVYAAVQAARRRRRIVTGAWPKTCPNYYRERVLVTDRLQALRARTVKYIVHDIYMQASTLGGRHTCLCSARTGVDRRHPRHRAHTVPQYDNAKEGSAAGCGVPSFFDHNYHRRLRYGSPLSDAELHLVRRSSKQPRSQDRSSAGRDIR